MSTFSGRSDACSPEVTILQPAHGTRRTLFDSPLRTSNEPRHTTARQSTQRDGQSAVSQRRSVPPARRRRLAHTRPLDGGRGSRPSDRPTDRPTEPTDRPDRPTSQAQQRRRGRVTGAAKAARRGHRRSKCRRRGHSHRRSEGYRLIV